MKSVCNKVYLLSEKALTKINAYVIETLITSPTYTRVKNKVATSNRNTLRTRMKYDQAGLKLTIIHMTINYINITSSYVSAHV